MAMHEYVVPLAVSALLIALCLNLHFRILRMGASAISEFEADFRRPMLVILTLIFTAHLIEVVLFAIAYWLIDLSGTGSLVGISAPDASDYFYFSIVSYTTLGIGDIAPQGAMRLVAGIEALTGLLLIAWSASFTYLMMERLWSSSDN